MTRAAGIAAMFLAATLLRASVARAEGPTFPVETVALSNGLRVLLAPDPLATLVSLRVVYFAGQGDDPDGLRGLAHLTEHLVAARSEHIANIPVILDRAGATWNATTSDDTTEYFETLAPERLETGLWVESERMGYASHTFSESVVATARSVISNEQVDHKADAGLGATALFALRALLPGWHPYAPGPDVLESLAAIRAADVQAFVNTWYSPSNAEIVIAGRFERDQTLALVRRYFESLPDTPTPVRPRIPTWTAAPVRIIAGARVPRNEVAVVWATPPFGAPDDAALDLAAFALTGSADSLLERQLVDAGLATRVSAWQQSKRETSFFWISATCAPGVNPGKVIRGIVDGVRGLARGLDVGALGRARARFKYSDLSRLESTADRAIRLAVMSKLGPVREGDIGWSAARYEPLGTSDVARATAHWLAPDRRVEIAVFAGVDAPPGGRILRRDELRE
jgi:zinc protease